VLNISTVIINIATASPAKRRQEPADGDFMHLNVKAMLEVLSLGENEARAQSIILFGALILALLLSAFLDVFLTSLRSTADLAKTTEQSGSVNTVANDSGLVGPSAAEIHDLIYPKAQDGTLAPAVK
jgi:hypothetical protein